MKPKLTTEIFIERANKIHCNTYDYSLSNYIGTYDKIKIICKEHGIFEQSPNMHINSKQGCYKCARYRIKESHRLSTEEFINKAISKHGDKYDYSTSLYISSHSKIEIICKKHGSFKQNPNSHLDGHGCKFCGIDSYSGENHHNWYKDRNQFILNNLTKFKCQSMVMNILKFTGKKKTTRTYKILGYNNKDLQLHLQKDPNYDKWIEDQENWHIDHIFPIKAFIENNIYDPGIINRLDNLQILPKQSNLIKSSKYNRKHFYNYLKSIGINL